jgi:hypothetical protein
MNPIKPAGDAPFDVKAPILIIGAGAAGYVQPLLPRKRASMRS